MYVYTSKMYEPLSANTPVQGLFICGGKGLKPGAPVLQGSRLAGTLPECRQSPSVNKSVIGCWPVRTGLHEKSNYCPCGFKAAPR